MQALDVRPVVDEAAPDEEAVGPGVELPALDEGPVVGGALAPHTVAAIGLWEEGMLEPCVDALE
eukprot:15464212-Alexandrium_andersonii.AAC.1